MYLIHFVLSLLSQLKHIVGLADQRAHASTFKCVRLCSEGKIVNFAQVLENLRKSSEIGR